MSLDRTEGHRRTGRRAFRPTLDGGLESRFLLSNLPGSVFLKHPKPGVAYSHDQPQVPEGTAAHQFPIAKFPRGTTIAAQAAHGGQSVIIATPDGSHFIVAGHAVHPDRRGDARGRVSPNTQPPIQGQTPGVSSPVQPLGHRPRLPDARRPGRAHRRRLDEPDRARHQPLSVPSAQGLRPQLRLRRDRTSRTSSTSAQITVNSGLIAAILGFHTADLSGPLVDPRHRSGRPDRRSTRLLPGASIGPAAT